MKPIIICKNIHKFFGAGEGRIEALRGIDMTINAGEIRLLMGPSGSGKTTLISIISGILTQDDGECLVDGIDVNRLSDYEKTQFRGRNIGFVFQAFNLIPMLTTEENISVPLLLNNVDKKIALERSKELLHDVGMGDKIGRYPADLSGGQHQRVAIARAMAHDPRIIVCDEPTSFLDHITGNMVMELLKSLVVKNNVTLIVVTHDPRITGFADKIDILEDGKIISNK